MKKITKYIRTLKKTETSAAVLFCFVLLWAGTTIAAPLELFVSIPPQKYLIDQLGGELVHSHVLVGQGQSPHLFHPTSQQIRKLSRAKLLFSMDMEFEHILTQKLKQSTSSIKVVNCVSSIQKIPFQKQSHVAMDPHVWLSPMNLKIMTANMAQALIAADPANAQMYSSNLENLNSELESLDQVIRKELAPFAGASFYVFHPSFGYFAKSYHLHQEAVEVAGKSPTPKQLSALIAKARKEQVKVIFVQAQFDPRSAAVVARAIDGEVVPLDPLAENVIQNLRIIATRIQAALSR